MTELATQAAAPKPRALAQVVRWIVAGHDAATIAEAIEAQYPNEKPAALHARALKELAKAGEPDPAVVKGWAIEAVREIYVGARDDRDWSAAMKAVKWIWELSQ